MYTAADILKLLLAQHGEHIRLEPGLPPSLRVRGELYEVEGPELEERDMEWMLRELASHRQIREFREKRAIDFIYSFGGAPFLIKINQCFDGFRLDLYDLHRWLADRPPMPQNYFRPDIQA